MAGVATAFSRKLASASDRRWLTLPCLVVGLSISTAGCAHHSSDDVYARVDYRADDLAGQVAALSRSVSRLEKENQLLIEWNHSRLQQFLVSADQRTRDSAELDKVRSEIESLRQRIKALSEVEQSQQDDRNVVKIGSIFVGDKSESRAAEAEIKRQYDNKLSEAVKRFRLFVFGYASDGAPRFSWTGV